MAAYDIHQRASRSTTIYGITCGKRTHHLVVRKGRIRLHDHPDLTTDLLATFLGRKSLPPCVKALLAIRHRTYDYAHETVTLPSGVKITYRSIPSILLYTSRLLRFTRKANSESQRPAWRDQLHDRAVRRYFDPFCEPLRAARFYITFPSDGSLTLSNTHSADPFLFRRHGRWILKPSGFYGSTAPCVRRSNANFHCWVCNTSHPTTPDPNGVKDLQAHCQSPAHRQAVDRLLSTAITAWGKHVAWQRNPAP